MGWREIMEALSRLEPAAFNPVNAGAWPLWAKLAALVLVFALVIGLGYPWFVASGRERLALAHLKEEELQRAYRRKAARSALLRERRRRYEALETTASSLFELFPSEGEVPDLLEDITVAAADNGLVVRSVELKPERRAGFYSEQPMEISVEGGFHGIGSFVSRLASLPRVVTLHDFGLESREAEEPGRGVRMHLLARIYKRTDDQEEEHQEEEHQEEEP